MECRLTRSERDWSCQIKIRWEYHNDGRTRREEVAEVDFGPFLSDKALVEPMLRRAQAAILNPDISPSSFAEMSDDGLKAGSDTLPFSRNVICLELSGPDLVDLSFVDLPGM